MTALQKNIQVNGFSSDCDSVTFSQNAYTHGLESIYKLECIDLKSVRKLVKTPEKPPLKLSLDEELEHQLSLDLGPFFRGWMVPSLLQEPIQVLQLSKQIEKILLEKGYKTLKRLEEASLQSLGLGQGHSEEVQRKLKHYTEGKPRKRISRIDFQSMIKCLFGNLEWKKVYVFLASFDINEWVVLSPADSADIKKLSFDNKQAWSEEVKAQVDKNLLLQFYSEITDTWIKPWMMARGGLATSEEIKEALLLRCLDPAFARGALDLLFTLDDPLKFLQPISGGFAVCKPIGEAHEKIENTALSYYKNPATIIPLKHLSLWVAHEFASQWKAVNPEPSIRFSPCFECFREGKSGEWMVGKNFFGNL